MYLPPFGIGFISTGCTFRSFNDCENVCVMMLRTSAADCAKSGETGETFPSVIAHDSAVVEMARRRKSTGGAMGR